jgi:hypothetical protein
LPALAAPLIASPARFPAPLTIPPASDSAPLASPVAADPAPDTTLLTPKKPYCESLWLNLL